MNFLAHLFLSDESPEAMIGSILPDLVRGRLDPALPPEMLTACVLHRRIDAFTDTHPLVARSKNRLRDRHGHYAGILVDIFYDHFLAADFMRYAGSSLDLFVARLHRAMSDHRGLLPEAMRLPIDHMIAQDWLRSYAEVEGIRTILARMSIRLSVRFERPVDLSPAADDLAALHEPLADDFRRFFPELIAFARQRRAAAPVGRCYNLPPACPVHPFSPT